MKAINWNSLKSRKWPEPFNVDIDFKGLGSLKSLACGGEAPVCQAQNSLLGELEGFGHDFVLSFVRTILKIYVS